MATVPNADTVGGFWLDQNGRVWEHVNYTELPTVVLVRVDSGDEYLDGTIEDERIRSLRRLVPEEPLAAPRQEPAADIPSESFKSGARDEIYRQMQAQVDKLKGLDLQEDDIRLITDVVEEMFQLGKKAGELGVDQDPATS